EDLRFPRAEQRRGPSDLTESSEGGDPDVVLSRRNLAREAAADLLQERLAFVVDRPQILADLFDGLRGDRRRSDDFRGPPDVFLVDHDRGAFEVDLRDFHVVRDHFLHDASRVVQNVLDGHRTSLWPEPSWGLRPVSYSSCASRLPCRRTS